MRLWKHVVTCSGGQKQHGTGLFDTHTNLYSVDYTANSIKNLKLWPSVSSVFPQNSSEAQRKKKITCWPDWLNYFPFLEIFSVWGQRVASPDFLKESVVRMLQNLIKTCTASLWSISSFHRITTLCHVSQAVSRTHYLISWNTYHMSHIN